MNKKDLKIGITLSGGGIRAMVFHLGVLEKLAQENLLQNITEISTVSGGSLLIGLIYSLSNNKWPSNEQLLNEISPKIKKLLTEKSLQFESFLRLLINPWNIFNKANVVSKTIRKIWRITSSLNKIKDKPIWSINATCFETGKRFRFKSNDIDQIGDYLTGYTNDSKFKLSDAIACSAAFPGLIGCFKLNPNKYRWYSYKDKNKTIKELKNPLSKTYHIWDGGVYDNLGTEPLFKNEEVEKFKGDFNFLIVSDASQKLVSKNRGFIFKNSYRLLNITMDQVRSLRARYIIDYFSKNKNKGFYLQIGNTVDYIQTHSKIKIEKEEIFNCLSGDEVKRANDYPTTLKKIKKNDFGLLKRHGWETANYTMKTYCHELFQ